MILLVKSSSREIGKCLWRKLHIKGLHKIVVHMIWYLIYDKIFQNSFGWLTGFCVMNQWAVLSYQTLKCHGWGIIVCYENASC